MYANCYKTFFLFYFTQEYEKLISFSGTPSVIWRRTGEICLVGKEFSLLTQWSKDMLLNRKVYIYEVRGITHQVIIQLIYLTFTPSCS
jgi:hypothetical protein